MQLLQIGRLSSPGIKAYQYAEGSAVATVATAVIRRTLPSPFATSEAAGPGSFARLVRYACICAQVSTKALVRSE